MPVYLLLSDGQETTKEDLARGIWVSVNGVCNYWTDDWSKLSRPGNTSGLVTRHDARGIPVCPYCGSPGRQMTAQEWEYSCLQYEAKSGKAGYYSFLVSLKETCGRKRGLPMLERFELWPKEQKRITKRFHDNPPGVIQNVKSSTQ